AKFGSSAIAKGVMLSAMPLAVADLTKSRREILIVPRLYWRNSFFNSVRRDLLATASLTIFGRGSTRPAALRNFNARGRRAAEQRDEMASSHSITSSASARSVGGTSMPTALARPFAPAATGMRPSAMPTALRLAMCSPPLDERCGNHREREIDDGQ